MVRLTKFLTAFADNVGWLAKNQPFFTFLVLPVGLLVIILAVFSNPEEVAAYRAQKAAEYEATALRCKAKSICHKYGTVRQECATAGDFNNCVRVKMGSDAYGYIGMCTEEGGLADSLPVPSAAECLVNSPFGQHRH